MRSIIRVLSLLVLACHTQADDAPPSEPAKVYTQDEAVKLGWPQLAGPFGTFSAAPVAMPLVGDLSQAKLLWTSECADLGRGKGSSQSYRGVEDFTAEAIGKMKAPPGSWAGPIVGGGVVYVASWRPTGPWFDVQGSKVRLDAEDLIVAMDPLTGKTKWETYEPGGILRGGGKRSGFQVAPVYHKSVVYSVGSTARIFAHDAATGKRLWVSEEKTSAKDMREEALAAMG